jgi:predicted PhzF superfamily epimerase YddE/YHI9
VQARSNMASGPLTFVTMVVFTAEKFQGNPLAVVAVHGNALTQKRKSLLAKEFKFSETVFLHDARGPGEPRLLEIFTETGEELPFAGHPLIGTAHYVSEVEAGGLGIFIDSHDSQIFNWLEKIPYDASNRDARATTTLITKAGPIQAFFNPYRQVAACSVPHNFHLHSQRIGIEQIITTQPHIQIVPTIDKEKGRSFPLISIVKGMTFALIDLTDNPEVFGALEGGKSPEAELDEKWKPSFVGAMYYKLLAKSEVEGEPAIHNISARMISHGIEDPGTGSACCALSCFLALGGDQGARTISVKDQKSSKDTQEDSGPTGSAEADLSKRTADVKLSEGKIERKVFGIQQGAEMGRLCTIAVEVDIKTDASGKQSIASVILSGRSMMMTRGELLGF